MDSRRNKEKRRTAKVPTRKRGGEDTRVEAKKSRALEEPDYTQESSFSRNAKKDAQEKVKKIFEPVKHQIQLVLEYINILEMRRDLEVTQEIMVLAEFISNVERQCNVYLNAQFIKLGKGHG